MFSGSTVYSPGDNYPGQTRSPSRDFVPSSWTPSNPLTGTGGATAIAAGVALAIIFLLSRGK